MIVSIVNVPYLDENAVLGDGGDLPVDVLGDLPDPVPGLTDRRAGPLPRPARPQVAARVRVQQVGRHHGGRSGGGREGGGLLAGPR